MNSMCIVTIFDFFRSTFAWSSGPTQRQNPQQKKALPAGKRRKGSLDILDP